MARKNEIVFFDLERITVRVNDMAMGKGMGLTEFYKSHFVPGGWLRNTTLHSKEWFLKNGYSLDVLENKPMKYGVMQKSPFYRTMNCLQLDVEKFLVSEDVVKAYYPSNKADEQHFVNVETYDNEIVSKLDELIMAINKLGNIQMQNMEYLQKINKKMEELTNGRK